MRDARGFTLLEVLIAFVIAALALGVMFQAAVGALRASHTAAQYDEAVARARSHLAMATNGGALMPGDWNGDDGGGYHWRLHVAPIASTTAHAAAGSSVPLVLYSVSVTVSWPDGDQSREVRLVSEQIGQPVNGG
jgi:general secretion pathway protein I